MSVLGEWFATRGRGQRLGLSVLAGALMTAGHAPVDLPWTLLLAVPVIVLLTATAPRPGVAALVGWGVGFGYFVTGLHWVGYAFLVDPDQFALLLPLGVAAMPAGLALFWALAFWLARRVWPASSLIGVLSLAGFWSMAEYARGHVLTGFPWALPGYVWAETPVIQAVAWAGPYGLSFLTLVIFALPALWLMDRRIAPVVVSVIAIAGLWAAGATRLSTPIADTPEPTIVRVVQPNAPQHLKWREPHVYRFYDRALAATSAPADPELGAPDVIVWPETAVAYRPADYPEEIAAVAARAGGAHLLIGALHREPSVTGTDFFNALFTIRPDGSFGPRYDKHHLVPFGEFMPLPWLLETIGLRQLTRQGGFSRGSGPETIKLDDLPTFSPLICYEAIFPHEVVGAVRPEWLVQVTNDAWFGPYAGPQQHLAQARIRAIEQGLPMVRAANTGISAVIDPYGRIVVSLALNTHGGADARLPTPLPATIYAKTGDWPALVMIVACLLLPLAFSQRSAPLA